MAQKTVTTCDRCKSEFEGEPALHLFIGGMDREEIDLCQQCLNAMVHWVKLGVKK